MILITCNDDDKNLIKKNTHVSPCEEPFNAMTLSKPSAFWLMMMGKNEVWLPRTAHISIVDRRFLRAKSKIISRASQGS